MSLGSKKPKAFLMILDRTTGLRIAALFGRWALPLLLLGGHGPSPAEAQEPVRLKIVGGLAGINQYTQHEEPFWTRTITALSGGRIVATIQPFDRSGLRGQDMLKLMKLGVVPFGTGILSLLASEEPELNAIDLPALNPSFADLRRTIEAYRPHVRDVLRERHGVELLGIYAYPAQVAYCANAFDGLAGLSGRRVRTSSVGQSELVAALGATPVLTPFSEIVDSMRKGVVDCAITGTLSGYEIGLSEVTTHVHGMALSWGISFFGANRGAWEALPEDLRGTIRSGIEALEAQILDAADRETVRGLACNTGQINCEPSKQAKLVLVPVSAADEVRRRRLVQETVLPGWIDRCGPACVKALRDELGPVIGMTAER